MPSPRPVERWASPLIRRFPALATLQRVSLGEFPTPVECAEKLAAELWIKREDLAARPIGGNKVRALEFLLGGVRPGDRIVTAGAAGSTHALATAVFGRRLGAHVSVFRWPQEMSPNAAIVAARVAQAADYAPISWSIAGAYLRATALRLRERGTRWIPAGGSSPLGVLGQVDGALELAEQIAAGLLPAPRRIVVPLGSGGTAAGLVLGARLAGIDAEIIAVRVAPRVVANRGRVLRLARGAARLIERLTGAPPPVPRPHRASVRVVHGFYGGAYGRPTAMGSAAAERCARSLQITVDATYSAKALAASLVEQARDDGPTLFWLTFDGRILKA